MALKSIESAKSSGKVASKHLNTFFLTQSWLFRGKNAKSICPLVSRNYNVIDDDNEPNVDNDAVEVVFKALPEF